MKKWFSENVWLIIGAILGIIGGYLYWKFVGCESGTCAITSNPYRSMIYFGIMGALMFSIFKKSKKSSTVEKINN